MQEAEQWVQFPRPELTPIIWIISVRVEKIGSAMLYLGDCREIVPSLGPVECVIADPPYGMAFRSNYRNERYDAIAGDDDGELLSWAAGITALHSVYLFGRWDNIGTIPAPKSIITWIKNNWSMGDLEHEHARQTEVIFFYPGERHYFPNGRPTDVVKSVRTGNELHPTQKPTDVMEQLVSFTIGTVLDPFMGSGTTGVACAKMRRPFVGIEIDERYFDTACRRIEATERQPDLLYAV